MRNIKDAYKKAHLSYTANNEFQLKKDVAEVAEDLSLLSAEFELVKNLVKATVTFDSDGGSAISGSPFSIVFGNKVTKPDNPTKSGKTFVDWFEGESTTAFDFDTLIKKDTTLTAHWATTVYTVTFDSDGGSEVAGSPFSVEHGSTVSEPEDPTKEGKTFDGWFNGASETEFDFTTPITSNLTLTAHWS